MSDPMSNREIEDVLSSIKKLVTQDTAAAAANTPSAQPDKLVLTPAFRVVDQPAPPPGEPAAAKGDAPDPAPASLEQTIAELEAAISAYDGTFEPDGGEAPLPEPEARFLKQQDAVVATEMPAEPAEALPDAEPDLAEDDAETPVLASEGEMVLDEAMLRELITDVLREELQGVLGQRITRNVRKLVRAEIARALASRDLAAGREPH